MESGREARLGLEAFAAEASTSVERVRRLVEIGAIVPVDGAFSDGDVVRSRLLESFEAAGIELDHIAIGIRERAMTLEFVELFYPHPGSLSGRSYEAFAAELGERGPLLAPAIAAMGLPAPRPADPSRVRDEAVLRTFLESWATTEPEVTLRAARVFGEAIRRAAEAWVALFDEAIIRPLDGSFQTVDELASRVVGPASRVNSAGHELIVWLLDRHLERTMDELNIEALERELERRGLVPAGPTHPPAIAFVDLTGYTHLTEEQGDESAVRAAVRLGELSETTAREHGGRVVKLLGDGVLLAADPCRYPRRPGHRPRRGRLRRDGQYRGTRRKSRSPGRGPGDAARRRRVGRWGIRVRIAGPGDAQGVGGAHPIVRRVANRLTHYASLAPPLSRSSRARSRSAPSASAMRHDQ